MLRKGQATLLFTIFKIVLGIVVALLILGVGAALWKSLNPGEDDIAKTQLQALQFSLKGLEKDEMALSVKAVQLGIRDGFVIVAFDKGGRRESVQNTDVCRERSAAWKPEGGPLKDLPKTIEADPQCFGRSCICLYKAELDLTSPLHFRIFSASHYTETKEPNRLLCLQTGGIDAYVTYSQERWKAEIIDYIDTLKVVTKDVEGLPDKLEKRKEAIKKTKEVDTVVSQLKDVISDIEGKDKIQNYEELINGVKAVLHSYLNIMGGTRPIVSYPKGMDHEGVGVNYADVFIYGNCDDDETGPATYYLEKVEYNGIKTVFIGIKSPILDDTRKKIVQNSLVKSALEGADRLFKQKNFFEAEKKYRAVLDFGYETIKNLPEIEYKAGYAQYQLMDYETAINTFNSVAEDTSPAYRLSKYRLYSLQMIAEIYRWKANTAETAADRKTNEDKALETYQEIIDKFTELGESSKRDAEWVEWYPKQPRLYFIPRDEPEANLKIFGSGNYKNLKTATFDTFAERDIKAIQSEVSKIINLGFIGDQLIEEKTGPENVQEQRWRINEILQLLAESALLMKADVYISRGATEEARTAYNKFLEGHGNEKITPLIKEQLIELRKTEGIEEEDLKKEYGELLLQSESPVKDSASAALELMDRITTQREAYDKSAKKETLVIDLANLYIKAGLYQQAIDLLNEFIGSLPAEKVPLEKADESKFLIGKSNELLGKDTAALDIYRTIQDSESHRVQALERIGDIYLYLGNIKKARDAYRLVDKNCIKSKEELCNNRIKYLIPLGILEYQQGENPENTRGILLEFLYSKSKEIRAKARYHYGRMLETEGKTTQAVTYYKKIVDDPDLKGVQYAILAKERLKELCKAEVEGCTIKVNEYTRLE